jgi:hypothetical protein
MAWSRSGPVRSKPMTRATPIVTSELDAATAACKTATIARRYSTGAILSGRRNEPAAPRRQRGFFKLLLVADQNSPSRATFPCLPTCSRASEMLSKIRRPVRPSPNASRTRRATSSTWIGLSCSQRDLEPDFLISLKCAFFRGLKWERGFIGYSAGSGVRDYYEVSRICGSCV